MQEDIQRWSHTLDDTLAVRQGILRGTSRPERFPLHGIGCWAHMVMGHMVFPSQLAQWVGLFLFFISEMKIVVRIMNDYIYLIKSNGSPINIITFHRSEF